MSKMTITEALAEIKTLEKRIEKKRASIIPYLARQEGVKDALAKAGGSEAFIAAERQAIRDLQNNIVKLRIGINRANDATSITIQEVTKTISEWIIWRREISKGEQSFLTNIQTSIKTIRSNAQRRGENIIGKDSDGQPQDWIIAVDEGQILKDVEMLETILGALDGLLSLKNATTMIEY